MTLKYSPDSYDEQMKLKPSIGMILTMLYASRHLFLIFLSYFPLLRGSSDAEFIKSMLSPLVAVTDIPVLVLLFTVALRRPEATDIWRKIWRHGRLILILTLATQLLVDSIYTGIQLVSRPHGESNMLFLMYLLLDLYVLFFAWGSERIKLTFLDFPDPLETASDGSSRPIIRTDAYHPRLAEIVEKIGVGTPHEAERLARLLNESSAEAAEVWHRLALFAIRNKAYEDALVLIERSIEIEPENAVFYRDLSAIQRRLGQFNAAALSARKSIRFDPEDPDAYFNLAQALTDTGNKVAAISSYESVIKLRPGHLHAWHNLALLHDESGNAVSAQKARRNAQILQKKIQEYRERQQQEKS